MSRETQVAVDRLLLEQGEYLPLEYLLQEGRLLYTDYEAWRRGDLDYLDEALFGDPVQIRQRLEEAAAYLLRRSWQAEPQYYSAWGPAVGTSRPLRFSADHTLDGLFHLRYRRPQDRPQLDLFTDSPVTSLANGIIQALSERDPAEARRLLEQLGDAAPDHPRFGEFERLVEAAESLEAPVGDLGGELGYLRGTLAPLAENLLGSARHELLIPLWRRLSNALARQPFRPEQPDWHLSYAAAQTLDWVTVRAAVEREAGWVNHPVLLMRHARACEQQHDRAAALQSWFCLCWGFPEGGDALASSGDAELHRHWDIFQELDPELPLSDFPAWLLLHLPGLTRLLSDPGTSAGSGPTESPESYQIVYQLRREYTQAIPGSDHDELSLRLRLKKEDPRLFKLFLETTNASSTTSPAHFPPS